jgi:hypothetical protein
MSVRSGAAKIIELGRRSIGAGKSVLLRWVSVFKTPPRQLFFVDGEAGVLNTYRGTIGAHFHWR